MALSDCEMCWETPCACGHGYKNWSSSRKNELTKAINGFSIDEVFEWLDSKGYLTYDRLYIQKEFEKYNK